MYKRFKWNPKLRLDWEELAAPGKVEKPGKIFVGSTIDMYHNHIPIKWVRQVIETTYYDPQHTYITLTKFPQGLKYFTFPEWWWIGVTIIGGERRDSVLRRLSNIQKNIRFISFEPLLADVSKYIDFEIFDWIIIGRMTGAGSQKYQPKREWIKNIIKQANEHQISIFLKDNLIPIMGEKFVKERQKFPERRT